VTDRSLECEYEARAGGHVEVLFRPSISDSPQWIAVDMWNNLKYLDWQGAISEFGAKTHRGGID
jgi:hypothetical protein